MTKYSGCMAVHSLYNGFIPGYFKCIAQQGCSQRCIEGGIGRCHLVEDLAYLGLDILCRFARNGAERIFLVRTCVVQATSTEHTNLERDGPDLLNIHRRVSL